MKIINIIKETLKNKHNFTCFCIRIQNKKIDRIASSLLRQKVNVKKRKDAHYLCSFCKKDVIKNSKSNTIHHILPERYGGKTEESNLLVVCTECHQLIENCVRVVERQAILNTLRYLQKSQTNSQTTKSISGSEGEK